ARAYFLRPCLQGARFPGRSVAGDDMINFGARRHRGWRWRWRGGGRRDLAVERINRTNDRKKGGPKCYFFHVRFPFCPRSACCALPNSSLARMFSSSLKSVRQKFLKNSSICSLSFLTSSLM